MVGQAMSAREEILTKVAAAIGSAPDKAVLSMNSVAELLQFTRNTRLQLVSETTVEADP